MPARGESREQLGPHAAGDNRPLPWPHSCTPEVLCIGHPPFYSA
jgi:hypothetical protein